VLIGVYLIVALVPRLRRRAGGLIADGGSMEDLVAKLEQDAVETIDAQHDSPSRDTADADAIAGGGAAAERGSVVTAAHTASDATTGEGPREMARRLRTSLLLVVGLLVGTVLFGLEVAVPAILVLFLRLVTRETWVTTIVTTVLTCGALYLVFHTLLGVPFGGGLLLSY
jgi:hypothetical protein